MLINQKVKYTWGIQKEKWVWSDTCEASILICNASDKSEHAGHILYEYYFICDSNDYILYPIITSFTEPDNILSKVNTS